MKGIRASGSGFTGICEPTWVLGTELRSAATAAHTLTTESFLSPLLDFYLHIYLICLIFELIKNRGGIPFIAKYFEARNSFIKYIEIGW